MMLPELVPSLQRVVSDRTENGRARTHFQVRFVGECETLCGSRNGIKAN